MVEGEKKIWIGTSGWHYPHWKGAFYPSGMQPRDYMNHYLQYFRIVEINNSFYRLPSPETFAAWRTSVPDDFIFSLKASRFITHMKKLKDPAQSLERFMHNAGFLEEKLGPVLFQLPPSWKLNLERLREFLEVLPSWHRYTFEFRHPGWYDERVYDLLKQYNISFCIYELARHLSPVQLTSDIVYVRLHGPGDKYEGSYPDHILQEWAHQAREWRAQGREVYIYFDNDQYGYAAFNARTLNAMVQNEQS